jgi:hypothetical protein
MMMMMMMTIVSFGVYNPKAVRTIETHVSFHWTLAFVILYLLAVESDFSLLCS